MKRITKDIKRLDLIATLIDIAYALVYLGILGFFFYILVEPEVITDVVNAEYTFFGIIKVTSAQMNVMISLLVGYLLVFVPTAVKHVKRVADKETIELDPWDYRSQVLYAFMALFTGNIASAIIRFITANQMMQIIHNYNLGKGFIEGFKALGKFIVSLGDSTKDYLKRRAEYKNNIQKFGKEKAHQLKLDAEIARKGSLSQQDLERVGRKDLIMKTFGLVAMYTFLTFIAIFIFIPFYWMILTALKTNVELTTRLNPRFFIGLDEMQWVNFKVAFTRFSFWRYLGNTVTVGLISMVGTVTTTILAAFAFSRLDFKGREFIFSVLLMTMMIPGELYTITNYITVRNLGWYDSFAALIFPFMTSVFYIFFLRQSFKQIPDSLYRAAQVDGCGDFKYLTRVMIPIARPTITTITILSAIGAWDAYIWPQLVAPSEKNWLISVALRSTSFVVGSGSDARPVYNVQLAATALVTVPLLIIFFSLKKYIIRGVGRSGTKG
jgi:ABC-type glycerol-3-phosphate transport system permease component